MTKEEEDKAQQIYDDIKERRKNSQHDLKQQVINNKIDNFKSNSLLNVTETSKDAINCTSYNKSVYDRNLEHKSCYKNDFEAENIRRKMAGEPKVSLEEFNILRQKEMSNRMFDWHRSNRNKNKKKSYKNRNKNKKLLVNTHNASYFQHKNTK